MVVAVGCVFVRFVDCVHQQHLIQKTLRWYFEVRLGCGAIGSDVPACCAAAAAWMIVWALLWAAAAASIDCEFIPTIFCREAKRSDTESVNEI